MSSRKGIPRLFSEIEKEEETGSRVGDFLAAIGSCAGFFGNFRPTACFPIIGQEQYHGAAGLSFYPDSGCGFRAWGAESEYPSRMMRFLSGTLFARAAGVIVQTEEARQFFPAAVRKRAVILKNPLNPAFVRPMRQGEPDGRIVSVGRMDANKNHEMILRAFGRIARSFRKAAWKSSEKGSAARG